MKKKIQIITEKLDPSFDEFFSLKLAQRSAHVRGNTEQARLLDQVAANQQPYAQRKGWALPGQHV